MSLFDQTPQAKGPTFGPQSETPSSEATVPEEFLARCTELQPIMKGLVGATQSKELAAATAQLDEFLHRLTHSHTESEDDEILGVVLSFMTQVTQEFQTSRPEVAVLVHDSVGYCYLANNDAEGAEVPFTLGIQAYEQAGAVQPFYAARLSAGLAQARLAQQRPEEARDLVDEELAALSGSDEETNAGRIILLGVRAQIEEHADNAPEAALATSLEIADLSQQDTILSRHHHFECFLETARLQEQLKRYPDALSTYQQALEFIDDSPGLDPSFRAHVLHELIHCCDFIELAPRGKSYAEELVEFSAQVFGEHSEQHLQAVAKLANQHLLNQDPQEAERLALEVLEKIEPLDDDTLCFRLAVLEILIDTASEQQQFDIASDRARGALSLLDASPGEYLEKRIELQVQLSSLAIEQGDCDAADASCDVALRLIGNNPRHSQLPGVCRIQGMIADEREDPELARFHLESAIQLHESYGHPDMELLMLLYWNLGSTFPYPGEPGGTQETLDSAIEAYARAREIAAPNGLQEQPLARNIIFLLHHLYRASGDERRAEQLEPEVQRLAARYPGEFEAYGDDGPL